MKIGGTEGMLEALEEYHWQRKNRYGSRTMWSEDR